MSKGKNPTPVEASSAFEIGPDPFDPENLRIEPDGLAVAAERVLVRVGVRKPNPQVFFRIRPGPEWALPCRIIELREERETYLVTPEMVGYVGIESRPVVLRVCITISGTPFFWPVPIALQGSRNEGWGMTARAAALQAETRWTRMVADMNAGAYAVFKGADTIAEPIWPEQSLRELLHLAFGNDCLVNRPDHPVMKRLRGEV